MTRDETAYREATRDPIFLLQVKQHHVDQEQVSYHNLEQDDEGRFVWPNGRQASDDTLEKIGVFLPYWEADGVFLDREEAEKWAESRRYDYGRKGRDWRVYCLCAEGALASVLRELDATEKVVASVLSLRALDHGSVDSFDKA